MELFEWSLRFLWVYGLWNKTEVVSVFSVSRATLRIRGVLWPHPLRYWFLCCDDEPMICLETTGRGYSRKGVMIDLKSIYARRHNLYDVVAEIRACIAE